MNSRNKKILLDNIAIANGQGDSSSLSSPGAFSWDRDIVAKELNVSRDYLSDFTIDTVRILLAFENDSPVFYIRVCIHSDKYLGLRYCSLPLSALL